MEIKTIVNRLDNAPAFDAMVNAALAEGWHLVKRDVILPVQPHENSGVYFHTMLYAELAKLPEPLTFPNEERWQDAVRIIKDTCADADDCDRGSCPMYRWCDKALPNNISNPPAHWPDPEDIDD